MTNPQLPTTSVQVALPGPPGSARLSAACLCSGSLTLVQAGIACKADWTTDGRPHLQSFWFSRSGIVPRICISNRLPGNADSGPTLWELLLYGTRQVVPLQEDFPQHSSPSGFFSQSYCTFKLIHTAKTNPLPWEEARQAMENEGIGWAQMYIHSLCERWEWWWPGKFRPQ